MNAYVCTYLHPGRGGVAREWRLTEPLADGDPDLRHFLDEYSESFWDWGDDPSFFAAQQKLGDVRLASWGVCRADVRRSLNLGDLVIFFCAKQEPAVCRYYFIGAGTVGALISRADLWSDPAYLEYRSFYNILVRLEDGRYIHRETFYNHHVDWEHRSRSPYVIFDPEVSRFNLTNPMGVATWKRGGGVAEVWNADKRSQRLERLLFKDRNIVRRLRTSNKWFCHARLNLGTPRAGAQAHNLPELRQALFELI